jgi:hypothetical protein
MPYFENINIKQLIQNLEEILEWFHIIIIYDAYLDEKLCKF